MSIIVRQVSDADLRTTEPRVQRNAAHLTVETATRLADVTCPPCSKPHDVREHAHTCLACGGFVQSDSPLCTMCRRAAQ